MPARYINDPEHWAQQAAHMRELAMTASATARDDLLNLAKDYDRLAKRARIRARGTQPQE
jgi:hypothetical protein